MNGALWLLLKLRVRSAIRLKLRKLRTVRGLIYLFLGAAALGLVVASPAVYEPVAVELPKTVRDFRFPANETMLATSLAVMCLLTLSVSSGPAIYFNPAETNFLFSGPFSRRQLLAYKIVSYVGGVLLTAIVVGLLAQSWSGFFPAFCGTLLGMVFLQLVSASINLADHEMRLRRISLKSLMIAVLAMLASLSVMTDLQDEATFVKPLVTCLMTPFRIFAHIFLAKALWPDLLSWGTGALVIDLSLFGLLLWQNFDFRESVAVGSQRLHQRWQRAQRSGVWSDWKTSSQPVPFVFGRSAFGIVAWRQLTHLTRTFRGPLYKLFLLAICVGPVVSMIPSELAMLALGFAVSMALFLLPKIVPFDFRSDWDFLMNLRALPVSASQIAVGQLVTPVLVLSALEGVAIVSMVPFYAGLRFVLISVIPLLLPFNALIVATDNLMFLLSPAPLVPMGRLDFEFFGRSLIEFLVRIVVIALAFALSLGLGQFLASVTGRILLGWQLGFWIVFSAATVALIPALAWAFRSSHPVLEDAS